MGRTSYDSGPATLTITTTSLSSGDVGVAYSQTLAAANGTPPYTWSIASGSPPAGLSLNATSGAISGTPTTAGTANFTARVTDSASATANKTLSMTINAALAVSTASLPSGAVGSGYAQTLAASGGSGTYTWSITSGALPAGLSLNSGSGAITGTPSAAVTANFTVQVADGIGTATRALSITINPQGNEPPVLASIGNQSTHPGWLLQFSVSATDPNGDPLTYSASNLPSGSSFNGTTHVFSWTPASGQAGSYPNVRFAVTDGALVASENITINVIAPADTTPPQISGTASVIVSTTSVNIKWTTNELSTSQVEYAASPTQLSSQYPNLVTSHLVPLVGFSPAPRTPTK